MADAIATLKADVIALFFEILVDVITKFDNGMSMIYFDG